MAPFFDEIDNTVFDVLWLKNDSGCRKLLSVGHLNSVLHLFQVQFQVTYQNNINDL